MNDQSQKSSLRIFVMWLLVFTGQAVFAQTQSIEQIKNNLLENPPDSGNSSIRKETILVLDRILLSDSAYTSETVFDFYQSMMQKVTLELSTYSGNSTTIWMMYNHGFLVKTPKIVFAFDLINGHYGWQASHGWEPLLPDELVKRIQVLFISHDHIDHADLMLIDRVKANGASVVSPSEDPSIGTVLMAANSSTELCGLHIDAYDGLHTGPLRMYHVISPGEVSIFHTGDNSPSRSLPELRDVDVLLLNVSKSESGMASSVQKVNSTAMIPGHIQELGHDLATRMSYQAAYDIRDPSVAAKTHVMVWGEKYTIVPKSSSREDVTISTAPQSFQLSQNYPNPFNPSTTISYQLSAASNVTLKVYDLLGREVATLVNQKQNPGSHSAVFEARNLPTGVYFYRLSAGSFTDTKKLILLR